ncbi:hypothetical protein X777_02292 [Ooceraea biroi]|uniref:Uncharacterized protein n=1 Tax=Ooceraea biroi TaxID=2015173 RepID=A0A026WL74_OOCBI|nr:hypothetical protein X777_02292 [Ooceraea biroi]
MRKIQKEGKWVRHELSESAIANREETLLELEWQVFSEKKSTVEQLTGGAGRRQRSTSRGKPPLDSEIAHGKGKGKGRRSKVKERWPFIEGLTVDELARYRRRRVQDQPKDNLQPHPESAVRDPASEYRRAFGVTSIEELSKNFSRERPKIVKPDDEIGRADGSKVTSPSRSKFSMKIDQDPEYQSKYLREDYPRDRPIYRKPPLMLRPTGISSSGRSSTSDRSPSASRRRDKYWLSDTNVGQCDRMAVAQDLDAFRVLDTRFHDDNVTGKPPPASRRSSRHSQITVAPRPTQLELADRAVMRTRSPSPTYRLHVCDVDNEPRGFGRQSSGRIRSPSADRTIHDNVARPYSPSFGRTKQDCRRGDSQPFVVLADASKDASCRSEMRRRRTDRNVDVTVPISRGRPRTPTRWMPPWYDNTNTI